MTDPIEAGGNDSRGDNDGRERQLPRAEAVMLALAFCLPFCSVARVPPNAAFWGQWAGALLFAAWLCARLWRTQPGIGAVRAVSWVGIAFPAVAAVIAVQMAIGVVRSPTEAAVAIVLLLLAGAVCVAATTSLHAGERAAALQAAAGGILAAFVANTAATVLGWTGYAVILFEIARVGADSRAVGLIGQANHFGTLCVLALAAAAHLRSQDKLSHWAWVAVVVVAALMCAATGSRIAVVEWLLVVGLAWWLRDGILSQRGQVSPMGSVRGGFGALVAMVLAQLVWIGSAPAMSSPSVTVARGGFENRVGMLSDAFQMWTMHPVLGVGHGNYAGTRLFELSGSMYQPDADHAHNLFAQALAEWGGVGFLIVVAGALFLLRAALRPEKSGTSAAHRFCAMAVLCLLAHSLVEHPLWFVNLLLPFAWFAGMLRAPVVLERGPAAPWGPTGRIVAALLVVAASALVALDYGRSQSLAMRAAAQGIGAPDVVSANSLAEVSQIAVATLFPTQVALLQARSFAFDAEFAGFKSAVAEQALRGVPSAETAARYVVFSALSGRQQDGDALLAQLAARNARLHEDTLAVLALFSATNPSITAIVPRPASAAQAR